jgi:hypothetical protein
MRKKFSNYLYNIFVSGGTLIAYESYLSKQKSSQIEQAKEEYIKAKLEQITENQEVMLKQNDNIRKSVETITNNQSSSEARGEATSKIMEEVNKIISNNNNNLIDFDFTQLIERYKEFLSILSIEQVCFVINITTSLFILGCVFSIFSSHSGNYIIDKLNLDTRFPKLSKFIRIRVKFQHYHILLDLLLITLSVFFLIYINYITLIR